MMSLNYSVKIISKNKKAGEIPAYTLMKITAISDLHGYLPEVETCDLLCICGDISPLEIQRDHIKMTKWIFDEFQKWIANLPCSHVILVPGNHDFWFSLFIKQSITYLFDKLTILIDGETNIYDDSLDKWLKIYGVPYIPLMNGNWVYEEEPNKLKERYKNIPKNVDILLTHAAPCVMCDVGHIPGFIDVGSILLTDEIIKKQPKYVFCGHIHDGNHTLSEYSYTDFNNFTNIVKIANVSLLNDDYKPNYKPLTIMLKCCEICGEVYSDDTDVCFFCNKPLIEVPEIDNSEINVEEKKEILTNQQPCELREDTIDDEELDFLIEEVKDYELENNMVIENDELEVEVIYDEDEDAKN